jgi:phosphoribosylformylglycinamidine synthase PurS subunit
MKARVEVAFRPGVLDPEAVAIARALGSLGFAGVSGVRRAKVIELELAATDRASAEAQVEAMCQRLLANPVIETYRISLAEGAAEVSARDPTNLHRRARASARSAPGPGRHR